MLGFMDLRWPRVFRRSNVGLVNTAVALRNLVGLKYVLKLTDDNWLQWSRNQLVTSVFPFQRESYAELLCFLFLLT